MPSVQPQGSLSPTDVFGGGMAVPVPGFLRPEGEVEEEEDRADVANANAVNMALF